MALDNGTLEMLAKNVSDIAREAGKRILEVYDDDDFGVETKSDDSPLTRADRLSNEVICNGLEALDMNFPIISEENRDVPYEERKDYEMFWLVDPLDGTKEFIKRNGEFTVNIALIQGHAPLMGVVYVPVTDELYYGVIGLGAFKQTSDGVEAIKASSFRMDDPGLSVVCSRSHLNDETQAFVDALNEPQTVSRGSSLKFLVVAEGKAQLYPRIAPTMEWDTGAAQCILEAAGGKVVQYGTSTPLQYNKENLLNPYFTASGDVIG